MKTIAKDYAKPFYSSKLWRETRKIILYRDRYTCQHCYGRAEEIHHIKELTPSNINDYSVTLNPDNLISLCHDCHTKITKGYNGDVVDGYVFEDGQLIKI